MMYLQGGKLVGNRRKLSQSVLFSDLEYVDDLVLVASSWEDLGATVHSLNQQCHAMGVTINSTETKSMAVLPDEQWQVPVPINLQGSNHPVEAVSSIPYLGSVLADHCSLDTEVSARISRASQAFRFLSHLLWYQKRIRSPTKSHIFKAVVIPTLLYSLESAVLLEPHVHHLQSFIMSCSRIILRISLWNKQCNTTLRKLAKQHRASAILVQCRLRLLGHLTRMDNSCLPKKLLVFAPAGGNTCAGGHKCRWNDLVTRDLKDCELEDEWQELAQDRSVWRCFVQEGMEQLNQRLEQEG